MPAYKQMLETCGFERVAGARNEAWGPAYPVDGYVHDLSTMGFEAWIEAVMNGRRPPIALDRIVLVNELQGALRHWTDDEWLSRSRLVELPMVPPADAISERAAAVREVILHTLARARAQALVAQDAAYRAIDAVYLAERCSRKLGARNLAVSRATLYRLVKRGIYGLAEALS